MWEEIKTAVFSFYIVRSGCKCVCVSVCPWRENATHAALYRCCVINGQGFLLRDADYEMFWSD